MRVGEQVLGPTGVDVAFTGTAVCADDVLAHFDCGFTMPYRAALEVAGEDGVALLSDPWHATRPGIVLRRRDEVEHVDIPRRDSYRLQLENVSAAIRAEAPLELGREDAVAQARVLEALYAAAAAGETVEISPPATAGARVTYARRRALRPHAVPPLRPQRAEAAGHVARPLAELRRRAAARAQPAIVRRAFDLGHHALRPGQQLRPAVRLGRGDLRRADGAATCGRTATSSSSRRRRAGTCGRARTASSARASTCSRASTSRLKRMKLDYVDIFYSHRYDPDTPLEETMGALDTAVRQGKALYAGISSYSPEKTREAHGDPDRARHAAADPPAVVLDAEPLDRGRPARRPRRARHRLHRFSPLAQGMLTDRYLHGIPEGSRATQHGSLSPDLLTEQALAKIRALNEIAERRGQTLAQMALAWTLRDPRMTSTLIGREQPRSSSRTTSRRSTTSSSPTTSWPRSTATRRRATSTSGRELAGCLFEDLRMEIHVGLGRCR